MFWPSDAAAHTCDAPFTTDLVTARGIDVGQVTACNDAEFLTVTYETAWPWCVLRTHLHVARDLAGIPRIRLLGTPNFLRFDFIDDVDCEVPAPVEIPLEQIDGGVVPGDTVTIAARAVVEGEGPDGTHPRCLLGDKCVAWGKGSRFRPRLPAMYFTYEVQAPPPETSCLCDDQMAVGGTTGAEILAQLCPGGELASGATFSDGPGEFEGGSFLAVSSFVSGLLHYEVGSLAPDGARASCGLLDRPGAGTRTFAISPSEFEACRQHLMVSCGQPVP